MNICTNPQTIGNTGLAGFLIATKSIFCSIVRGYAALIMHNACILVCAMHTQASTCVGALCPRAIRAYTPMPPRNAYGRIRVRVHACRGVPSPAGATPAKVDHPDPPRGGTSKFTRRCPSDYLNLFKPPSNYPNLFKRSCGKRSSPEG